MASPPPEFVDTWDVPDPTRSVLEPIPHARAEPLPRIMLEGEAAEATDEGSDDRRQGRLEPEPTISYEIDSGRTAAPPPIHRSTENRSTEHEAALVSRAPWLARLGDGSWPVVRSDQLWGVVAAVLLIILVILAIQRGPILPSFDSTESGAPGSGNEDPTGPEAVDTELSGTARSSERLGDPTGNEDDGVVSQPATDTSNGSRAKIFSRSSRKKATATTAPGGTAADDRDTIEFDPDDSPGDGAEDGSVDGMAGVGGGVTTSATDEAVGSTTTTDDGAVSTTSRRSTTARSSGLTTTRPTIDTTTSTTRVVISTAWTTTTKTSSTTTTSSPTSAPTTRSTTTVPTSTTSTVASSTSSTAPTTTSSTAGSSSTTTSTAPPTTSDPGKSEPEPEPDPDPDTDSAVTNSIRPPVE